MMTAQEGFHDEYVKLLSVNCVRVCQKGIKAPLQGDVLLPSPLCFTIHTVQFPVDYGAVVIVSAAGSRDKR